MILVNMNAHSYKQATTEGKGPLVNTSTPPEEEETYIYLSLQKTLLEPFISLDKFAILRDVGVF